MVKSLEQLNQEFINELTQGQPSSVKDEFEQWFEELQETPTPAIPAQTQTPMPIQAPTNTLQQLHPDYAKTIESASLQNTIATEAVSLQPVLQPAFPEVNASSEMNTVPEAKTKKRSTGKLASDIVFYAVVAFLLITTLLYSGRANNGFNLFGYSGFVVLSGSMEEEIPEGALVITRKVKPEDIKLGDDITFIRRDNATVTHRVVNIIENYEDSGSRAFQTQGLANPEPDSEPVYEGNVIGIVKHSIPELGFFLNNVSNHIGLVFILLGGVLIVAIAVGKSLSKRKEEELETAAA